MMTQIDIRTVLIEGKRASWCTWPTGIAIVFILIGTLFVKSTDEILNGFSVTVLLSASIAGLALTLPLLTAMFSVLPDDDFKKMFGYYLHHDKNMRDPKTTAFFESFAPFIWIEILFGLSAFLSLLGSVINFGAFYFLPRTLIIAGKITDICILGLAITQMIDLLFDTILTRMDKIQAAYYKESDKTLYSIEITKHLKNEETHIESIQIDSKEKYHERITKINDKFNKNRISWNEFMESVETHRQTVFEVDLNQKDIRDVYTMIEHHEYIGNDDIVRILRGTIN